MATFPKVRVAEGQLSALQVNANSRAGTQIVAPIAGHTITVVDCWMRTDGNTSGATAVVLEDTAGVDAVSNAVAGLTAAAILRAGATHSTATSLGTALTKGKGLRIGCTVGDFATSTVLDYCVLYKIDG